MRFTFFRDNPGVTLHVATGLARRLVAADARLLKVREEIGRRAPGSMTRGVESIRDALRSTLR